MAFIPPNEPISSRVGAGVPIGAGLLGSAEFGKHLQQGALEERFVPGQPGQAVVFVPAQVHCGGR